MGNVLRTVERRQVKDVCRQVCRPGLADGGIRAIAMSAMQAAFDPGWGANKGDFRCCLTLPHQKVEYKHLSRALQWHTYGINFYSVMTSYPGGLSGRSRYIGRYRHRGMDHPEAAV